jgi:hypothetical protein
MVLAVAVALYCLLTFLHQYSLNSDLESREASLQAQIDEVWASVEAVKELEKKKRQLNAKQEAIGKIMSDRMVWSKVLYDLAGLVPEDVWLSDLKEDVKITQTTVPNPDPDAAQKTITKAITTRKFKVGGYAMSPRAESGVESVGQLVRAMEDSADFSKQFRNPTPQRVFDEEFDKVSVKKFEIWTDIEVGGSLK